MCDIWIEYMIHFTSVRFSSNSVSKKNYYSHLWKKNFFFVSLWQLCGTYFMFECDFYMVLLFAMARRKNAIEYRSAMPYNFFFIQFCCCRFQLIKGIFINTVIFGVHDLFFVCLVDVRFIWSVLFVACMLLYWGIRMNKWMWTSFYQLDNMKFISFSSAFFHYFLSLDV